MVHLLVKRNFDVMKMHGTTIKQSISFRKTDQLMMFKEIVGISFEIRKKRVSGAKGYL